MINSNDVPDTVALSYDREHKTQPDWQAAHDHAKTTEDPGALSATIERVKDLWENPGETPNAVKVSCRDAEILAIGGADHPKAVEDRESIEMFCDSRAAVVAGFDGPLAAGTRDCRFAWWLTPEVIWAEIEESEDMNPADFAQQAIEEAIMEMVNNNDWAYQQFNEMRQDIIEMARRNSITTTNVA